MDFDAITIMALADELNERLAGGRVQDSVQVDDASFGLEVYARHARRYLLLSADQQYPRVHLVGEKLRRGAPTPSPLGLLLRRYVEGARIDQVTQPPWERVLTLHCDGPQGVTELVIEPMERRANVLLLRDDGVIIECARRVGPQDNRVRISLPGKPYVPPPPQTLKRDPMTLTLGALADMLDNQPGERARQILTRRLFGFSPQVAKEVVFRATGGINTLSADTSARALFGAIGEFFDTVRRRAWQPGIAVEQEQVLAFAVYPLTHMPGWTPQPSVSAALERFYGPLLGEDAYGAAKAPVQAAIDEAKTRVEKKLGSLREALQDDAALEHLRKSGELLLAYQYTLKPGQAELRAAYEVEGPELTIALDPALTPLENAQRYFERYDKAKRARAEVPQLIAASEQELAYLLQLETDLALARNWPDIGEVQEALQANGYWRGEGAAQPRGGRSGPLKLTLGSYVVWVGRNARQNEIVTFDKGGPADLWLHVRGVPGAHVIIKSGAVEVPDEVVRRAAAIAAYYSQARSEGRVGVDVTRRKYVRKIKGGKPGMVTYSHETTIDVAPEPE